MKNLILKSLFSAIFVTSLTAVSAQEHLQFHHFKQLKSEQPDPSKSRTFIFISASRGQEIYNVDLIVATQTDSIIEFELNNRIVPYGEFSGYQWLTDSIKSYINRYQLSSTESTPTTVIDRVETGATDFQSDVNDAIQDALKADGFIKNNNDVYDFVLTYTQVFINGKVQDEARFKKYKRIYEEKTGTKLGPNLYYHIRGSR